MCFPKNAVSCIDSLAKKTCALQEKGKKKTVLNMLVVSDYVLHLSSFNVHAVHFPTESMFHEPIGKLVAVVGVAAKSFRLLVPQNASGARDIGFVFHVHLGLRQR